ncbi:MAG TPA: glycosyltransferase [Solirubrobacterales bacterium]|nr:glycosyltransferase [Solirubrobacterales bacterium]
MKRVCIVSSEHSPHGGIGTNLQRQAELLASRYDVTLLERPEPSGELRRISFSCEDHLRSAAVLEAIEAAYPDGAGPEYLEVCDYRALGLVPLQARAAGHPLLRDTTVAVQVSSTAELLALHDRRSGLAGEGRVAELEREQFRLADLLLWPGGDILDVYRRYYGPDVLPPAVRVGRSFPIPPDPPRVPSLDPEAPLRILYAGRLQRLKGVLDLVGACLRLPHDDWQLTLIGADTETAPMGQSVRLTIEAMCARDPRVRIEDALPHDELQRRWADHDLLAVPSRFEVCATVALEAMRAGLPVLSTPVGGQTAIVEHGVNGWLAEDVGVEALARALGRLLEDRGEVERVRASGEVFERFRRITDPQAVLGVYEELLEQPAPAPPSPARDAAEEPLVTAVIPYYDAHAYVREAVGSLLAQTHRNLEVVLVNDGSFAVEDAVLDELGRDPRVRLVHQLNRGDAAARNLGIDLAEGDYLMMFDADNVLEPEFVARALAMLRADPDLAYVTCWLRFVDSAGQELEAGGYAPLGNRVLRDEEENWDGDTIALFPRRVLTGLEATFVPEAAMHSDWLLYRRLRARGQYGAVIPERLARYRVHPASLLRTHEESLHRYSWREAGDRRKIDETRWVAEV